MIVAARNFRTGIVTEYVVPSIREAEEYSRRTDGVQWDPIDRKNQSGGLPMVWARVEKN